MLQWVQKKKMIMHLRLKENLLDANQLQRDPLRSYDRQVAEQAILAVLRRTITNHLDWESVEKYRLR